MRTPPVRDMLVGVGLAPQALLKPHPVEQGSRDMKHMLSKEAIGLRQDRLLTTLDRLLELPTTDVNSTLNQVVQLVGEARVFLRIR